MTTAVEKKEYEKPKVLVKMPYVEKDGNVKVTGIFDTYRFDGTAMEAVTSAYRREKTAEAENDAILRLAEFERARNRRRILGCVLCRR